MLREKPLVRFVLTPIAVAVLMFAIAATAFAQTDTGKISGTVKDQNGAIVPGANITVTDTRTGLERSAKANDDGFFSVAALITRSVASRAVASWSTGSVVIGLLPGLS